MCIELRNRASTTLVFAAARMGGRFTAKKHFTVTKLPVFVAVRSVCNCKRADLRTGQVKFATANVSIF